FHALERDYRAQRNTPQDRLFRLRHAFAKQHGEILDVLNGVLYSPAVIAISGTCKSITLSQKGHFERRAWSDVGIAIIYLTKVIGLITIAVSKDQEGAVPV